MSETVIGRCSLCDGDVVKPDAIWSADSRAGAARCRACGATEAPPDRVIPMRKPATQQQSLQQELQRLQQQRALQDAVSQQFLPKPCRCHETPMLDPNRFRGPLAPGPVTTMGVDRGGYAGGIGQFGSALPSD